METIPEGAWRLEGQARGLAWEAALVPPLPGSEHSQPWVPYDFQGTGALDQESRDQGHKGVASIVGSISHLPARTLWFSLPLACSIMWGKAHTLSKLCFVPLWVNPYLHYLFKSLLSSEVRCHCLSLFTDEETETQVAC